METLEAIAIAAGVCRSLARMQQPGILPPELQVVLRDRSLALVATVLDQVARTGQLDARAIADQLIADAFPGSTPPPS